MTNNAAIVSIIKKITEKKSAPCKKTLQKIVYLVESKKIDLGCDYGIHFYGPYSADLDFAIRELHDEGILDIKYTAMEHQICVADDSLVEPYENSTIDKIVDAFGNDTPSDLELIATSLYVYLQVNDQTKIRDGVVKLKGTKFSDQRITKAISRLIENGYIES